MNKNIVIVLFALAALANISGHFIGNEDLLKYSKPLLMPFLLYYVYESSKTNVGPRILFLLGALVFSWAGDLALMQKDNYFLLGVILFFIAQLIYISLFWRATYEKPTIKWVLIIPYILYGGVFFYILIPSAGDMQIPVFVYGISLLCMASSARLRQGLTNQRSFNFVSIGALFFVVSDSLLAYNRFVQPVAMAEVWIMSTYILAQYLIVEGVLSHSSRHS